MTHGRILVFSTLATLFVSNPAGAKPKSPESDYSAKTYKVYIWQENGDTLWRIAQKVYGDKDKWPLIYNANRDILQDPNKIYPRQVLKIPPLNEEQ